MTDERKAEARTTIHGAGAGTVRPEEIEKRARELAEIDGRTAEDVNDDDRARAKEELLRLQSEKEPLEELEGRADLNRNPADPAAYHGEEAPHRQTGDEESYSEEAAEEGVSEAGHEQMLEAERDRESENTEL